MQERERFVENHFMAMMSRMKYIERWALMRNSKTENISEHSLEVAMITHALAVIGKVYFQKEVSVERAVLLALYHDCTEILTGDMPTPIKYYSKDMKAAFQQVEEVAANKLLEMLPEGFRAEYEALFFKAEEDAYLWKLEKAADKISAFIKCIEERKAGNTEFRSAEKSIRRSIEEMHLEEVEIFFREFMPSYEKNLDELNTGQEL